MSLDPEHASVASPVFLDLTTTYYVSNLPGAGSWGSHVSSGLGRAPSQPCVLGPGSLLLQLYYPAGHAPVPSRVSGPGAGFCSAVHS
jgi:hypothetical protein